VLTIAVDFDGTIVKHCYPEVGPPIGRAIEILKRFKGEFGCRVILSTCREPMYGLEGAVEYCRMQGLEFDAVNRSIGDGPLGRSKVLADLVIDDRSASRAGGSVTGLGDMTPEEWERIEAWVVARCRKAVEDYERVARALGAPRTGEEPGQ